MMRRFSFIAVIVATVGLLCLPQRSDAGVIDFLYGDGSITELEDDDFEKLIDNDQSGTISQGDYLLGMYSIQTLNDKTSPIEASVNLQGGQNTFTGLFLLEVDFIINEDDPGADILLDHLIVFESVDSATWDSVLDSIGDDDGTIARPTSDSTIITVYDDDDGFPFINTDGDPGSSLEVALESASDGTQLFELGFRDGDEFFVSNVSSLTIGAPGSLANFIAGLNVTHQFAAAGGVEFLDHDFLNFGNLYEYELEGDFSSLSDEEAQIWDVRTDNDAYVRVLAIPEPASCLIWGLGAFSIAAFSRMRRKKATV